MNYELCIMHCFKEPCGGFIKCFGDEVRVRQRCFFATGDLDGGDAEILGELHVRLAVAEHGSVFQIYVEIFAGGFEHASFRFAAVAVGIWCMGAVVDASQTKAFGGKEFLKTIMDGGKIIFREIAAADTGLIRDENDAIACVTKAFQAFDGAFGEFDSGGIGEVFLVDDERVITIDEDVVFVIHFWDNWDGWDNWDVFCWISADLIYYCKERCVG